MKPFMDKDFLLQTDVAKELYHNHAAKMPIFDYHCHINPKEIAEDKQFKNMTEIWLYGDHYKWRGMRTNGVDERYCTGEASDWEKFEKWAETVPNTLRNPLYHWTHLELKRFFGVEELLSPSTAKAIWDECNAKLQTPEYSCRGIIKMANVHTICTTDDPVDSLEYHRAIKADGFETEVLPAWRPDKAMAVENTTTFNQYIDKLEDVAKTNISSFSELMAALDSRHEFFHANGCRLSDHGVETVIAEDYSERDIANIFEKVRGGSDLTVDEVKKFQ